MRLSAVFIIIAFFLTASINGQEARKSLFHIKRNKNRNQVHYAIKYDKATCTPSSSAPVYAYWLDLEIGPNVINPIGTFEQIAYGIKEQSLKGNRLDLRLRALSEKAITVNFDKSAGCNVTAHTSIKGSSALLKEIYVFAEEGLIKPTVKYIDVKGMRNASPVTERIHH